PAFQAIGNSRLFAAKGARKARLISRPLATNGAHLACRSAEYPESADSSVALPLATASTASASATASPIAEDTPWLVKGESGCAASPARTRFPRWNLGINSVSTGRQRCTREKSLAAINDGTGCAHAPTCFWTKARRASAAAAPLPYVASTESGKR